MALKTICGIDFEYDADTGKVLKIIEGNNTLDFTEGDRIHPVELVLSDDRLEVCNVYALDQKFAVVIASGLSNMLLNYVGAPAAAYLNIHSNAVAPSTKALRKVLLTYSGHLSRTDTENAKGWVEKNLRALALIGNNKTARDLTAAIETNVTDGQHMAFVNAFTPYLQPEEVVKTFTKVLELYFGMISRERISYDILTDIPLNEVSTRVAPKAIADWALEHGIINEQQATLI